jgi:hypothetical protein
LQKKKYGKNKNARLHILWRIFINYLQNKGIGVVACVIGNLLEVVSSNLLNSFWRDSTVTWRDSSFILSPITTVEPSWITLLHNYRKNKCRRYSLGESIARIGQSYVPYFSRLWEKHIIRWIRLYVSSLIAKW